MRAWRRYVPGIDDVLSAAGAIGGSVAIGGLFGELWGLLLLSALALCAGILIGRAAGAAE